MKKAVLIFPSTISMVEFILAHRIPKADSNTKERTLSAIMTPKQIELARRQFGAKIKSAIMAK